MLPWKQLCSAAHKRHLLSNCAFTNSFSLSAIYLFRPMQKSDHIFVVNLNQSKYQAFTCTLNRVRKGINHLFQSSQTLVRLELKRIGLGVFKKAFQFDQSDYKRIIWLHVNVANVK